MIHLLSSNFAKIMTLIIPILNKNNSLIIMTTQEGQFEANGNGKK